MIKYYTPGMEKLLIAFVGFIVLYLVFRKIFEKQGLRKSEIKLVSVLPVGQKEKIILCEVKDKRFIMGVTQHKINHLYTFDEEAPMLPESSVVQEYDYTFVANK